MGEGPSRSDTEASFRFAFRDEDYHLQWRFQLKKGLLSEEERFLHSEIPSGALLL